MTDMTDTNPAGELEPAGSNGPEPTGTPGRKLTRNRKIALIGGAAAVIGLGAIAAPVLASNVTGGDDHDKHHEQFEQDLAQKLGVPQEKVDGALREMQGDRLGQRVDELQQSGALTADQATAIKGTAASGDVEGAMKELRAAMTTQQLDALVKQGTITQAQADEVQALVRDGAPIGLRVPPPDAAGDQQPEHVESADHQKAQVQELQQRGALTAEQAKAINAQISAGKTAEAEQAIHAAMDAGMLKQLVQDGTVTQAQADRINALIEAGVPVGLGGPGMGGHHGGPGMGDHHGMRGGHHGPGMDGDQHGSEPGADHGLDGGQQGQSGSQGGQFQPQTYEADSNA